MNGLSKSEVDLSSLRSLDRRAFLFGSAATVAPIAAMSGDAVAAAPEAPSRWLGRDWWGNRLQDWVRNGARIECVAPAGHRTGRTVSHLTSELRGPSAVLEVRTGTLRSGAGFSGFVIGTGVPGDDWRARVLVGSSSGRGGGLLATYESDGTMRFRDHTDEAHPHVYAEKESARRRIGASTSRERGVLLRLRIRPDGNGLVRLELRALHRRNGKLLAVARKTGVDHAAVTGGVGLVSSAWDLWGAVLVLPLPRRRPGHRSDA